MMNLEVRPEDSMIVRLMKSRLGRGERIYRRLRKGSGTELAYLTKIFYAPEDGGTYVLFNTGFSNKFNKAIIKDDDEDWNLIPGSRKGTWQLQRAAKTETGVDAVTENTAAKPMLYELIRQRLKKGELVFIHLDATPQNSPTADLRGADGQGMTVQVRGDIPTHTAVEYRGRTGSGRDTIVISWMDNGERDSVYFYADTFDEAFDLQKGSPDGELAWTLVNRRVTEEVESVGHTLADMINVLVKKGKEVVIWYGGYSGGDAEMQVDGATHGYGKDGEDIVGIVYSYRNERTGDWQESEDEIEIVEPNDWTITKSVEHDREIWTIHEAE
jgi:hypothetical protein